MYRFVGFIVITGFAIYGAKQFINRHCVYAKGENQDMGVGT
tara:strand:- start:426 stop:548 length:123 start_codon:yes stop_codon:yes gene_type:complete